MGCYFWGKKVVIVHKSLGCPLVFFNEKEISANYRIAQWINLIFIMKIKKITHSLVFHERPLHPFSHLANIILFVHLILGQQIYTVFCVFPIIYAVSWLPLASGWLLSCCHTVFGNITLKFLSYTPLWQTPSLFSSAHWSQKHLFILIVLF